ncbi:MAG: 16S rRNA methyltransferase [Promethearchaeota archaeon]
MSLHKIPTLTIIFLESALEPIRALSKNKKEVKNSKQKRNKPLEKTLLDVSIHSHLMQNIPDKVKRGRPDIIHNALLLTLGSRLNKKGYLQIYVHTRNDEIIVFNPKVRIPRNYNRFVGLMEQLFEVEDIPPNSTQTLISIISQSLEDLLITLEPNRVVLFTEKGSPIKNNTFQNLFSKNKKVVILIGGFPHGDFSPRNFELSDLKLSIYNEPLDTLVVLSHVIAATEHFLKFDE